MSARYLALCAMVRDEPAPYLREWVNTHVLAGVEHFLIFDNDSRVPAAEILAPWTGAGLVTVLPAPGRFRQMAAYAHCLERFGRDSRWIGFLDADEFIVPVGTDDFRMVLQDFEKEAGLALNWVLYGSSGHQARPLVPQIEAFTRRFPLGAEVNRHVKCVVHPPDVLAPLTPHHFRLREGRTCVNEEGLPVPGPRSPVSVSRVRINHYYFRSREDFLEKMDRGFAHPVAGRAGYDMAEFDRQEALDLEVDEAALKYLPRLRLLLRQEGAGMARAILDGSAPESLDGVLKRAAEFLSRRRRRDAERLLRLAACRHPESPEPWIALAGLCRMEGRRDEARLCLVRSMGLDSRPEAYYELSLLRRGAGDADGAARITGFLRDELTRQGLMTPEWAARLEPEAEAAGPAASDGADNAAVTSRSVGDPVESGRRPDPAGHGPDE